MVRVGWRVMKGKYTPSEREKGPRTWSGLDGRVMKGKYAPTERQKRPRTWSGLDGRVMKEKYTQSERQKGQGHDQGCMGGS